MGATSRIPSFSTSGWFDLLVLGTSRTRPVQSRSWERFAAAQRAAEDQTKHRRGFLAEGRECANDEQLRDPAWATVEAVELDVRTWGERALRFAERDDLRALERLYLRGEDAALLQRPKPRLRVLGLGGAHAAHLAAVLASPSYPALEALEVEWRGGGMREVFAAAKAGPVLPRVLLRIASDDLRELHALGLTRVEVIDATGLSEERTGSCLAFSGERLEQLHVSCTGRFNTRWALRALRSLAPGTVATVTSDGPVDVASLLGRDLERLGARVAAASSVEGQP